jgi:hypothetical protein
MHHILKKSVIQEIFVLFFERSTAAVNFVTNENKLHLHEEKYFHER